jgi:hypothetical protein
VTITRSRAVTGLAGQKRIPMTNITGVRIKAPGLQSGYITFSVLGEAERHGGRT